MEVINFIGCDVYILEYVYFYIKVDFSNEK